MDRLSDNDSNLSEVLVTGCDTDMIFGELVTQSDVTDNFLFGGSGGSGGLKVGPDARRRISCAGLTENPSEDIDDSDVLFSYT